MIQKPPSVANDPFKSAKWDEITAGRKFKQSDAPVIALLCQWYAIAQRCMDDIDDIGGQVAYTNDLGDLKALPQIATMKQASAEIRQLNKQLGIADTGEEADVGDGDDILDFCARRRANRGARAAS